MKDLRFFLGLIFFLATALPGFSQGEQYKFSNLDVNQGLSHNQIKCSFRDSQGFMWFGTISGLNRYDGYSIKTFRNIPGESGSISNSDINSLFEDPDGNIWMTTWTGTDIYDPKTETFSHDPNVYLRKLLIPDGVISDIKKDQKGNYWFVHTSQGLFRYDTDKKTTPLFYNPLDTTTLASNQISSIAEDEQGNFWILHKNGIFEKLDANTLTVTYRNYSLNKLYNQLLDYRLMVDADDDVWLFISDRNQGVFYFNSKNQSVRRINQTSQGARLNSNIVKGIVQDNKGMIWIATDHGGINLLDKKNFTVDYILNDPDDSRSLCDNSVNVLYKDYEGLIWIGTFKKRYLVLSRKYYPFSTVQTPEFRSYEFAF